MSEKKYKKIEKEENCFNCSKSIFIDISPITLMKLLPENSPHRKKACILLGRSIYKCKNCMKGFSVLDWQIFYRNKFFNISEKKDFSWNHKEFSCT